MRATVNSSDDKNQVTRSRQNTIFPILREFVRFYYKYV
jgi:hypothetical protein